MAKFSFLKAMTLPLEFPNSLFCGEEPNDVASWEGGEDAWRPAGEVDIPAMPPEPVCFPLEDDVSINRLIDQESDHLPDSSYLESVRNRFLDGSARQNAINWMLKVHAYYHFGPITAYLSVNYLDRFLSSQTLPQGNGWPFQLLSVTCISLAAKMEETHVPPVIDLQVEEPCFLFEARTIKRMELLVMANLKWRMRSITPFSFLDYFVNKLDYEPTLLNRLYSRATQLILSSNQVIDFLGFRPSSIAAAAVLCAAEEERLDFRDVGDRETASFYSRVSKEHVSSCHSLMQELLTDTCSGGISARPEMSREVAAMPPSPVGVLDAAACGSCDMDKSSDQPSDAAPPSNKRKKSGDLWSKEAEEASITGER